MALKDELKEGDYVRLRRNQGINRIIEIDDDQIYSLEGDYWDDFGNPSGAIYEKDLETEIEFHSSNIKDILIAGDYIDGNLIVEHPSYDGLVVLIIDKNLRLNIVPLEDYDVKDKVIMTGSQYKNLGYIV